MTRSYAAVLFTLAASPALAWRADVSGLIHSFDGASASVALAGGDAAVFGQFDCDPTLLRIDAASGTVVWRTEVLTNHEPCAAGSFPWQPFSAPLVSDGDAIVVAPGGEVIVLDATSGTVRWRRSVEGGRDGVVIEALTIDRSGGVVVAATTIEDQGEPETNFLVVSLDGATGSERWRQVYDGTPGRPDPDDSEWNDTADSAVATGIDAAGNVLVAGTIERHGRARWYLFQFDAGTGAVEWRQRITRQDVHLLAVDPVSDEVVIAGRRDGRSGGFAVQRFDAGAGRRRWRRLIRGTAGSGGDPRVLLVTPDGQVAIAGTMPGDDRRTHATVAWLDGRTGAVRWLGTLGGTDSSSGDNPLAFALDPTGNPVLSARVDEESVIVGLDSIDGHERWRWTPATDQAGATIRALVAAGPDVLAAGQGGDPLRDPDLLEVRLSPVDGAVHAVTRMADQAADGTDAASAVAALPGGDLAVAGFVENQSTGRDFAVVRLAANTGVETWRFTLDGVRDFFPAFDWATEITVDPRGDVIAGGALQQGLVNHDLVVVKLDGATGVERWRVVLAGDSDDYDDWVGAIKTDVAGNIILSGALATSSAGLNGWGMLVVKLDGDTGTELWRHAELEVDGWGQDVAVDAGGDVVVAGAASTPQHERQFAVRKLAGDTGIERWRTSLVGTGDYFRAQDAQSLALADNGDVIVAGNLDNFHSDGSGTAGDWLVVRLSGDAGTERWRYTLDGADHGHDTAFRVGIDGSGNVLVLGGLQTGPVSADSALVQLDGTTGAERWRRVGFRPGGGTLEMAVAANGDALVTGTIANPDDDHDVFVGRFAAADGGERWHRAVTGSAIGFDVGSAILERPDGAVVVAGSTWNADTGEDLTVVTLAGADGSDLPASP